MRKVYGDRRTALLEALARHCSDRLQPIAGEAGLHLAAELTALGFDTSGTDGRVGNATMIAVRNFQRKVGMQPADGYAGVRLLARLRQGL